MNSKKTNKNSKIIEKTLIIIPAYNEEKVIGKVIRKIKKEGFKNILIVNDCSTDKTKEIAKKESVYVINHKKNLGAGGATRTGLLFAKKYNFEYAILIDGDGQHDPKDIKKLLTKINEYDVIIGSRFLKKNKIPIQRRIYNRIASFLIYLLYGILLTDTQSGFKALNRKAIEKIDLKYNRYEFCSEFIYKLKKNHLKYKEIPINVEYNRYTISKGQNLFKGIKIFFKLIFEYK